MNEDGVFSLIDALYQPSFDLGSAARALGQGVERLITPHRAELAPRHDAFRSVRLETLGAPSPDRAAYLAGVEIVFREPQAMSFRRLCARLGEATEQPRLKPGQDRTFRLQIQGRERRGYALLLCARETCDRDTRAVRRIILRRLPAEGEASLEVNDGGVEDPNAYPEEE